MLSLSDLDKRTRDVWRLKSKREKLESKMAAKVSALQSLKIYKNRLFFSPKFGTSMELIKTLK